MAMTVANIITISRILTVPIFIGTVLYYTPEKDYLRYVALGIFLFCALSDALDGYIARTRGQMTEIGAMLDPLADKLLLISSFICLYIVGSDFPHIHFPIWLVLAVISRDIIVLVGYVVVHIVKGKVKVSVTYLGKAATFFQMLSVLAMLLQFPFSFVIWYAAFLLTIVSAIDYLRSGITQLN